MKMTMRFYVMSITEHAGGFHTVVMQPAYTNGANADWAKSTPSGRFEFNLSTEASVKFYTNAMRDKRDIHIEMSLVDLK